MLPSLLQLQNLVKGSEASRVAASCESLQALKPRAREPEVQNPQAWIGFVSGQLFSQEGP